MKNLYPDMIVQSVYDLTPEILAEHGILGLILDIDNTLTEYSREQPAEHTVEFLEYLERSGLKLAILSNGGRERVSRYVEGRAIPYRCQAKKPFRLGFDWAQKTLQLPPEKIAVVGDQIFTDIWGGNRAGHFTILTEPFDQKEIWIVKIKRLFEKRYRRLNSGKR